MDKLRSLKYRFIRERSRSQQVYKKISMIFSLMSFEKIRLNLNEKNNQEGGQLGF